VRQKLYNNDSILEQTVRQSIAEIAAIKAARDRDVMQLETQVEELQQELWEKSRFFQTAELELSDEVHYLFCFGLHLCLKPIALTLTFAF
jgi:hypothetical protein